MSLTNVDHKQEQIIETALKRFSHFGIGKTTMAEIADDLSLSKASLYYYFPDKTSLALSVGERILSEFIAEQQAVLEKSIDFEKGLHQILDVRISFGKKYFMMHIGDGQSDINTSDPRFKMILDELKSKELRFIANYIAKYQKMGILKPIDSVETAQVFFDMLVGIWICEAHINHKSLFPTDELFVGIKNKSERVIRIFCDGIKRD